MNEMFRCKCNNNEFWWEVFSDKVKCNKCYAEYKRVRDKIQYREFLKDDGNRYGEWEIYDMENNNV